MPQQTVTQADLAWAAGLYEGEGSIRAAINYRSANPRYGRPCAYTSMVLSTTDEDVIRRFHEVAGCGLVSGPHEPRGSARKAHWWWRAHRLEEIEPLVLAFAPYLGVRRLVQAANALAADTRGLAIPEKRCVKCAAPTDGSHRSYCKSCFAAYARARYHAKKESDGDRCP